MMQEIQLVIRKGVYTWEQPMTSQESRGFKLFTDMDGPNYIYVFRGFLSRRR